VAQITIEAEKASASAGMPADALDFNDVRFVATPTDTAPQQDYSCDPS